MKNSNHIVIAAGGTGGHFFPALALGLLLRKKNIDVTFMTDERTVFPEESQKAIRIKRIRLSKLKGIKGYIISITRMIYALPKLLRWLLGHRVDAVVGFGGYPSVPTLLAAVFLKIPIILHEQNAKAGRVNRLFAKRAKIITVAFENTENLTDKFQSKCILTGNPIRHRFVELQGQEVLLKQKKVCLILGGSQGAAVMAKWVAPAVANLPKPLLETMQIIHQSREEDLVAVKTLYAERGVQAEVATFFSNVPDLMQKARFAITRAGASTIAELTAMGCPAILLPYPHAMDDHQTSNAMAIAQSGGAVFVDEKTGDRNYLESVLRNMLQDDDVLLSMSSKMKAMGVTDAAERMCRAITSILP
ncbi:MAG: undecaprenyldiphospho-muramoylpentapeptide beta-N-acetylglucosaminyltransferase [Alphaproteobacteria bacterium]|nr:undecaprenyldiphospho-muramoylpentapeptide beta-N-acetylglucosaminyltransferase [Alphaproteobacteria bacterium]OJV45503.1 MAG: undecaprenyldiphospho-muramoylpentapeptide beta-N-acetylglucosaminyltransferase [Alphaproteobacteria bacterium 43-37]